MKTLILGGMRSGKSRMAEQLALASGKPVVYIATALAGDEEMAARIARHQQDRPVAWRVVEEPYALAASLRSEATGAACVLVDCLTLWITQLLCTEAYSITAEIDAFKAAYREVTGDLILVSNETGMGIVPMDPLTRAFCDSAGRLHQELAQLSDRVLLLAAGLPLVLKGALP